MEFERVGIWPIYQRVTAHEGEVNGYIRSAVS
jgi:hypothetical protein